jgi:hypothetical protein
VSGFGLPEKALVLVISPRNMRVVIARKQAFPKTPCIVHEIGYERFIVFVGISFLYPVQQMFQVKLNRLASFIDMWIQDFSNMVNGLRPALYGLVLILKAIKLTEYSDQAFQQRGPLFYSGIVQEKPEWLWHFGTRVFQANRGAGCRPRATPSG